MTVMPWDEFQHLVEAASPSSDDGLRLVQTILLMEDTRDTDAFVRLSARAAVLESRLARDFPDLEERFYSHEDRMAMASSGLALPDGSFPIRDKVDLKNARILVGKAKDKAKAAAHIAKRAAALGEHDVEEVSARSGRLAGVLSNLAYGAHANRLGHRLGDVSRHSGRGQAMAGQHAYEHEPFNPVKHPRKRGGEFRGIGMGEHPLAAGHAQHLASRFGEPPQTHEELLRKFFSNDGSVLSMEHPVVAGSLRAIGADDLAGRLSKEGESGGSYHVSAPLLADIRSRVASGSREQGFRDYTTGKAATLPDGSDPIGDRTKAVRDHLKPPAGPPSGIHQYAGLRRTPTDPADRNELKVARDTLKMHPAMAGVMGGPSAADAVETVRRLTGKEPRQSEVHPANHHLLDLGARTGRRPRGGTITPGPSSTEQGRAWSDQAFGQRKKK